MLSTWTASWRISPLSPPSPRLVGVGGAFLTVRDMDREVSSSTTVGILPGSGDSGTGAKWEYHNRGSLWTQ